MSDKAVDLLSKLVLVMEPQPMNYETFQVWDAAATYLDSCVDATDDPAPDCGATAVLFELEHAAKVFRMYEDLERSKHTEDGAYRAEHNRLYAERIETVLSDIFDDFEFSLSDSAAENPAAQSTGDAECEPCQGDIYAKAAAEIKQQENPCREIHEATKTEFQPFGVELPDDIPDSMGKESTENLYTAAFGIINGFDWSKTSEGHAYWCRIFDRLLQIYEGQKSNGANGQ